MYSMGSCDLPPDGVPCEVAGRRGLRVGEPPTTTRIRRRSSIPRIPALLVSIRRSTP